MLSEMFGSSLVDSKVGGLIAGTSFGLYAVYWMYSFRPKNFPPGPLAVPFIGTLNQGGKMEEVLIELEKLYGPVFSISKFTRKPAVIVNDYEIYRTEIKPLSKIYVGRPYLGFNDLFDGDKGVVFSNGSLWKGMWLVTLHLLKVLS